MSDELASGEMRTHGVTREDALVLSIGCGVGIVAMLVVLVSNTCQPLLRQPPARFVRARTLFTLLHASTLMAYAIYAICTGSYGGASVRSFASGWCIDVHVALQIISDTLETAIVLWQLVMAMDILMIVRDPFQPNRHKRKYILFVCLGTLISPATMLSTQLSNRADEAGSGGAECPAFDRTLDRARLAISLLDFAVIFITTAGTALLVMRLRTGLAISQRSRHRVTRQLVVYTVGYSLADAVSLVCNLLNVRSGVRFSILAIRGVWDVLVWAIANHNVLCPAGYFRHAASPHNTPELRIVDF